MIISHTNLRLSTSLSESLGELLWSSVLLNLSGLSDGHGCIMMKTKTLCSVLHVWLLARISFCIVFNLEQTFISTGFCNWKDATTKFAKHEGSQCHKEAVLKSVTLPSSTRNVGEMLSS